MADTKQHEIKKLDIRLFKAIIIIRYIANYIQNIYILNAIFIQNIHLYVCVCVVCVRICITNSIVVIFLWIRT